MICVKLNYRLFIERAPVIRIGPCERFGAIWVRLGQMDPRARRGRIWAGRGREKNYLILILELGTARRVL